jgi:hypothetical protein
MSTVSEGAQTLVTDILLRSHGELNAKGDHFLGYLVDLNVKKEADNLSKRTSVPDLPAVFTVLPPRQYEVEVPRNI